MAIRLLPIGKLKGSDYNPRRADPERWDLVELSLKKLGFLIPIYCEVGGEILSGNQRHHVATRMGVEKVPAVFVKDLSDERRKMINILFNKATNDMGRNTMTGDMYDALKHYDVWGMSEQFPDLDFNSDAFYPLLHQKKVEIQPIVKKNIDDLTQYSYNVSRSLANYGIMSPIIVTESGTLVNGGGRLQFLARKRKKEANMIVLPDEMGEFAKVMLNLLSMDFELHDDYKDILRFNSYMRPETTRPGLGTGMFCAAWKNKKGKDVLYEMKSEPEKVAHYKSVYGQKIVDFGAGKLTNTEMLKELGFDVTPFEPYMMADVGAVINKEGSGQVIRNFLERVKEGYEWDSIIIASVFNSVPFREDRLKIIRIIHSLCTPRTTAFCMTMSREHGMWQAFVKEPRSSTSANSGQLRMDYDGGTLMGLKMGKVQKFHTPKELHDLWKTCFNKVKLSKITGSNLLATCTYPKEIDIDALREAIEFEFDLPYPDGSTMGLVKEAKEAWNERYKKLGIDINL